MKKTIVAAAVMLAVLTAEAQAKTVKVSMTAKEVDVVIGNKGETMKAWTYEGLVPGPVVHVEEGDVVEFSLTNDKSSKNSHSVDFHAARVDVVKDLEQVKPGETRSYTFKADYPGVFYYHCGADPMHRHIAKGMYGAIIVEPKDKKAMPKADREYVIVQSELYKNTEDDAEVLGNKWTNVMFNGGIFKYDPVHDPAATRMLQAKPGERVRIYFVNAGINDTSSFHPIGGVWDRVYPSGNPKNVMHGVQTYVVGAGDAATFDMISPVEGANALVSHSLRQAMTGGIAIMQFTKDADPKMGRGDQILVR